MKSLLQQYAYPGYACERPKYTASYLTKARLAGTSRCILHHSRARLKHSELPFRKHRNVMVRQPIYPQCLMNTRTKYLKAVKPFRLLYKLTVNIFADTIAAYLLAAEVAIYELAILPPHATTSQYGTIFDHQRLEYLIACLQSCQTWTERYLTSDLLKMTTVSGVYDSAIPDSGIIRIACIPSVLYEQKEESILELRGYPGCYISLEMVLKDHESLLRERHKLCRRLVASTRSELD